MDDKQINKELLVERYLQGKLSAEEVSSFEEMFLSSGQLLGELEAAERLQQGVQDVFELQETASPVKESLLGNISRSVSSLFHTPRYAMAASIMLLMSLGLSSFLLHQYAGLNDFENHQAVPTQIIPMVTVRGAVTGNTVNTINLTDAAYQFVLMIDPGYKQYNYHRVTVYRVNVASAPIKIWLVNNMRPGYEDMLALSIPATVLKPGDYEIHLEGWQKGRASESDFEFIEKIPFNCVAR